MTTVLLKAPSNVTGGTVLASAGLTYAVGADGTALVDSSAVQGLLIQGWTFVSQSSGMAYFLLPPANDLVSIVAAAAPTSGTAMTIALALPPYACKLNVRGVYSGAVANLVVNIVGVDGRGNVVTETVNVAAASSTTFLTVNAYSSVTSVTPVGTTTNVTTLGVGQSNAVELPLPPAFVDLGVLSEGRMTGAAQILAVPVGETVGTVDTVAGTVLPSGTAPNGTTMSFVYRFTYTQANP